MGPPSAENPVDVCGLGTYCTRRAGKLHRARSRLYRRRFLRPNACFSAFFEIYKIYTPLHRFPPKSNIFVKSFSVNLQKIAYFRPNLSFFAPILMDFLQISLNLSDFDEISGIPEKYQTVSKGPTAKGRPSRALLAHAAPLGLSKPAVHRSATPPPGARPRARRASRAPAPPRGESPVRRCLRTM